MQWDTVLENMLLQQLLVMKLDDTLKLISHRGQLMQSLPGGGMLAIEADVDSVQSLIKEYKSLHNTSVIDIAAINSPKQTVISGNLEVIKAIKNLKSKQIQSNNYQCHMHFIQ